METSLAINDTLLERAFYIGGLSTENETVNLALEEFIEKRAHEDLIALFNSIDYDENYDYKKMREKR